jgi:predicted transcriptional regulator YdeE
MERTIIELQPFTVVGKGLDCPGYDASGIGQLWADCSPQLAAVVPGARMWGVSIPGQGGFYYLAAVEMPEGSAVPDGLESRVVAGGRYMRAAFNAPPPEMQAAFGQLYGSLAGAGEQPVQGGPCLEYYPHDCWDEATGSLKAELYVPLV